MGAVWKSYVWIRTRKKKSSVVVAQWMNLHRNSQKVYLRLSGQKWTFLRTRFFEQSCRRDTWQDLKGWRVAGRWFFTGTHGERKQASALTSHLRTIQRRRSNGCSCFFPAGGAGEPGGNEGEHAKPRTDIPDIGSHSLAFPRCCTIAQLSR